MSAWMSKQATFKWSWQGRVLVFFFKQFLFVNMTALDFSLLKGIMFLLFSFSPSKLVGLFFSLFHAHSISPLIPFSLSLSLSLSLSSPVLRKVAIISSFHPTPLLSLSSTAVSPSTICICLSLLFCCCCWCSCCFTHVFRQQVAHIVVTYSLRCKNFAVHYSSSYFKLLRTSKMQTLSKKTARTRPGLIKLSPPPLSLSLSLPFPPSPLLFLSLSLSLTSYPEPPVSAATSLSLQLVCACLKNNPRKKLKQGSLVVS